VKTQLMDGARNRPASLRNPAGNAQAAPQAVGMEQGIRQLVANGTEPSGIAERVVAAIRDEQFYVLPHPEFKEQVRARMEDIVAERNPGGVRVG
jgi:hypothetical protein